MWSPLVWVPPFAGIATGFWKPGEIQNLRISDRRFVPGITAQERQRLYNGWLDAVSRVKVQ